MILCIECKSKPVHVKKYQLCMTCYRRRRDQGHLTGLSAKLPPDVKATNLMSYHRETEFVRAFFDHDEWIPQPGKLDLGNGESYTPDFWDIRRQVFIEVAGTRQAYHLGKRKYELFRKVYPTIQLEVRKPCGELYRSYREKENKGDEQITLSGREL